ncbi:MAG: hypothetical protein KAU38_09460 [Desulfobacterales bacterium]|nr:hypothetical protein [Desulfobacterales bacterium]
MIELAYWWMDYTKKGLLRQGKGRPSMAVLGYAVVRRLVSARHLPASASLWQAGRSCSGEAGGWATQRFGI